MSDRHPVIDSPQHSHTQQPSIAPSLQLSRRGLVFSLLAMAVAGLSVYATFPESVDGQSLPVNVQLDHQSVATADQVGAVITEVLVIRNLSDHEIPKLSIKINSHYVLLRDSPLGRREEIVVPLRVFTDKRSSHRYDPATNPPETVLVTGQLPAGSRGLRQFRFNGQPE